jgi:hypothetical protein
LFQFQIPGVVECLHSGAATVWKKLHWHD